MTQETIVTGRAPPTTRETVSTEAPARRGPTDVTPPFSIRAAVWLMLTGALATMVAVLYWAPSAEAVRAQAGDVTGEYGDIAGRLAVGGFWAATVFAGIALVGTWVWLARANGHGRLWARTVSATLVSVLSVFMILSAFGVATLELGTGGAWAAIIAWIAGLTAVVLLFRRDATAYYADSQRI